MASVNLGSEHDSEVTNEAEFNAAKETNRTGDSPNEAKTGYLSQETNVPIVLGNHDNPLDEVTDAIEPGEVVGEAVDKMAASVNLGFEHDPEETNNAESKGAEEETNSAELRAALPNEAKTGDLPHVTNVPIVLSEHDIPLDEVTDVIGPGEIIGEDENVGRITRIRNLVYRRRGVLFAIASALFFSIEDVLMELLAEELNVFQITCIAGASATLIAGVVVVIRRIRRPRGKYQWLSLLISGVVLAIGLPSALLSLTQMSIGASVSIIYTMPIFAGIFAWIFLKEALTLIHAVFVLLSFAGVILIAQPEFIFGGGTDEEDDDNLLLGTVYGLVSALSFAVLIVLSRKQTMMGINVYVIMLCNSIVTCIFGAIVCSILGGWSNPSLASWLELVGFALGDFSAQILILMAVVVEAAVLVSLAATSEVIFAFILQIIIFSDYPDWMTIVGAVLIVMSCSGIAIISPEQAGPELEEREDETDAVSGYSNGGIILDDTKMEDSDDTLKTDKITLVGSEHYTNSDTEAAASVHETSIVDDAEDRHSCQSEKSDAVM